VSAGAEDILQMQVARFMKLAAPDLLWWHTPNGGTRRMGEARKLKDMGVLPGVPDLAFVLPGGLSGFIELKAGKNRLQPSQKAFALKAIEAGAAWQTCWSLKEVEMTLRGWGVELKATAQ
jgi:hypothetical protein